MEQGRWGYRGRQFRPGDASLYASLRARKAAHVSQPVRAGRGRRGGLYEFSTGEHGLTFRLGTGGPSP